MSAVEEPEVPWRKFEELSTEGWVVVALGSDLHLEVLGPYTQSEEDAKQRARAMRIMMAAVSPGGFLIIEACPIRGMQ